MDQSVSTSHREPWNKGKLVGQKAPLRVRDIWAIRVSPAAAMQNSRPGVV